MNLSSRLFPVFVMACATIGAAVANSFSLPILLGAVIGLIVGFSPLVIIAIGYFLLMAWRPDRPLCRCGRCRSKQYQYAGPTQITAATVYEYQCPFCSRVYRQEGDCFREVSGDGSAIPYMRISKWGRWRLDRSGAGPASEADASRG